MGYCPYMCVFCGDIQDNGWYVIGDWYLPNLLSQYTKSKGFKDKDCGQDICIDCIRKYKIQLQKLHRCKEQIAIEDDFS